MKRSAEEIVTSNTAKNCSSFQRHRIVRQIEVPSLIFGICGILAWICLLIIQIFDQPVIGSCEERSKYGAEPVDPVVTGKGTSGDRRTKRTSGIKRAAGEVDTCEYNQ